jgi:hypothetical protein
MGQDRSNFYLGAVWATVRPLILLMASRQKTLATQEIK